MGKSNTIFIISLTLILSPPDPYKNTLNLSFNYNHALFLLANCFTLKGRVAVSVKSEMFSLFSSS